MHSLVSTVFIVTMLLDSSEGVSEEYSLYTYENAIMDDPLPITL